MSIPTNLRRDSDIILMDGLNTVDDLLAEVARLTEERDQYAAVIAATPPRSAWRKGYEDGYNDASRGEKWFSPNPFHDSQQAAAATLATRDAEKKAEALQEAWLAIHVQRFRQDQPGAVGPDSFYAGIVRAKNTVEDLRNTFQPQVESRQGDPE